MPESLPLSEGRLTHAQTRQYHEDGFLFPIQAMSAEAANALRTELEEMEDTWLDNGLPLPLNSYKRVNAHCVMPLAHRIAMTPAILDAVEGVLGPDILIYSVEFFIKEPHTKHVVTMHQDLTYWGFGAVDHLLTAWLALSPATTASGCMDFVRGTHKNEILPHQDSDDANNLLSRGQEVQVDVADEDKVAIELQPGQMSLHHGLTVHGSGPNSSDDRRIGAVIRYCAPQIAQQVADKDYAMLARGADRVGNFIHISPPRAPFAPESLAIYDEIRAMQAQATMKDADTRKQSIYG
ncbi:phytanoyl-CoA dioxygenase family protein [Roseovarius sp. 2305UL8-3]|uniref:phytanoyl-CoA dioxygenase family protein n=1 Tax=Roseovarius conchicola TaxID=3121636 RepID=UPI0035276F3C